MAALRRVVRWCASATAGGIVAPLRSKWSRNWSAAFLSLRFMWVLSGVGGGEEGTHEGALVVGVDGLGVAAAARSGFVWFVVGFQQGGEQLAQRCGWVGVAAGLIGSHRGLPGRGSWAGLAG